jgi:FMN reductase
MFMGQSTVFRTIVALNGSPRPSSRTAVLVQTIAQAVARLIPAEIISIHLSDVAPHVLAALSRDEVKPEGEAILRTIESADLLVVGTPVYRASVAGALKHVFDLIDRDALDGRVALLSATGGTALHGLVGEHQLRPLLSFFRVFTTPTFVYGTEDEFNEARLPNTGLLERAERAAEEAAFLLAPRVPAQEASHFAL